MRCTVYPFVVLTFSSPGIRLIFRSPNVSAVILKTAKPSEGPYVGQQLRCSGKKTPALPCVGNSTSLLHN